MPLTHDFLGIMLGVRRAGVSAALETFQRDGLVELGRGSLTIRDRPALVSLAGDFYGAAEAEWQRLFGAGSG
jgi:hypothetical protein